MLTRKSETADDWRRDFFLLSPDVTSSLQTELESGSSRQYKSQLV